LDIYDSVLKEGQSVWVDKRFALPLDATPSPDRIVPFLVYLCTDAAAKISGSVFSLAGNSIDLYGEPVVERSLVKYGDPWTLEELMEQAPRSIFAGYKSPAGTE
jgi:hypothetical protein